MDFFGNSLSSQKTGTNKSMYDLSGNCAGNPKRSCFRDCCFPDQKLAVCDLFSESLSWDKVLFAQSRLQTSLIPCLPYLHSRNGHNAYFVSRLSSRGIWEISSWVTVWEFCVGYRVCLHRYELTHKIQFESLPYLSARMCFYCFDKNTHLTLWHYGEEYAFFW